MAFREDLTKLINSYGLEKPSNTPDFILAEYLIECLAAFNKVGRMKREHTNPHEPTHL